LQPSGSHILNVVLFTPLVGALVILLIPRARAEIQRLVANAFGVLGVVVALPLIWRYRAGADAPRFQFVSDHSWIPLLGVRYTLGIDGLSLVLVLLTTVLGAVAMLSSWNAIREREKEFYMAMLVLQTGMLGVFLSLDFVLFYVFWEAMLVPMYFLIGLWGSERRISAAIKFFLYTLAGSVVMLLGILAVYHSRGTFDMRTILDAPFGADTLRAQKWLFWGFFVAFAVKVPMFPFHTWLPDAHTEAPTAASVLLAGVLLKMGTYGFMRISVPMFPNAANAYRGAMVVLSLIAIVYGALVCLMQKDMKRLIAYSSVSHMGLCTLGIFALTPLGLSGSVLQQLNHGLATGGLFLLAGILYERRHTRLISEFGGLATPMPNFAAIYMIVTLSSLGLPLLGGFVGEFTVLRGAFEVRWQWAAWGLVGVILSAAYLLWLYQRVMLGEITNPANETLRDLSAREFATLVPLVALSFWIGVYPTPIFRAIDQPVHKIVEAVNPGYYSVAAGPVAPVPASAAAKAR
jgi:NADH-quinone oxidoreductase subunit M